MGRLDPGLHAGQDERGAGPQVGHPAALGEAPQGSHVRVARAAVVQHDRRAEQQAADQEVPHHPAGGGEPEEPVGRPEVQLQRDRLQHAPARSRRGRGRSAWAARWCPRSTAPTADGRRPPARTPARPRTPPPAAGPRPRCRSRRPGVVASTRRNLPAGVADEDGGPQSREPPADLGQGVAPVVPGAAVAVAVDRDQHLGLDLGEAVDHAGDAELGGAARPDRPDARRGQQGDHRLGHVGQVGDDPVALRRPRAGAARPRPPPPAGPARRS